MSIRDILGNLFRRDESILAAKGPTGWIDDPNRHALAATMPKFAESWKLTVEPTKPALLYKAYLDVLSGQFPPYVAQQIGDCVSQGWGRGNDMLQCVELALGWDQSTYQETYTEFAYGSMRQVGGHLGFFDGSYGSAAAKAAVTVGYVPRSAPYSGSTAKSWGRTGPPRELVALAKKLGGVARIVDWPGLVSAVCNGMPVAICSNQGFTMTRDRDGFCRASGSWAHCMLIGGVRFDRPGACILQSWGPDNPTGPTSLDQPSFSFWAERNVVEGILAQGDSFALMKAPEFTPRNLPGSYTRAA